MKKRKVFVEVICLVLLINFFYEGVYKIADFSNYETWTLHAPLLKPFSSVLKYAVPIVQIFLALLLVTPGSRKIALYSIVGLSVLFVFWVISMHLFTGYLCWPYHALWVKPTWFQKMIFSLGVTWMAFFAIIGLSAENAAKSNRFKLLRNRPANAS